MLKSALKTTLATELDDPSNTDLLNLIGTWIDDVVQDIASRKELDILNITAEYTLVEGTSTVDITGMSNIKQIQQGTTFNIFPKRDQPILMGSGTDFDIVAQPNYWFVKSYDGNTITIQFDRVADADYDLLVVGVKDIGTPLSDNDHIPFPNITTQVIKNGVRYYFYTHEQQYNSAQLHKADYERGVMNYLKNSGILASRTIMPQNSDLRFTAGIRTDSIFQGRNPSIPDPDA